jgi:hypothetical protein
MQGLTILGNSAKLGKKAPIQLGSPTEKNHAIQILRLLANWIAVHSLHPRWPQSPFDAVICDPLHRTVPHKSE